MPTCPSCGDVILAAPKSGSTARCPSCGAILRRKEPGRSSSHDSGVRAEFRDEPRPRPTHCFGCNKPLRNRIECNDCDKEFCSEVCVNRHMKHADHLAPAGSGLVGCAMMVLAGVVGTILMAGIVAIAALPGSASRKPYPPQPASERSAERPQTAKPADAVAPPAVVAQDPPDDPQDAMPQHLGVIRKPHPHKGGKR